MRKKRRGKGKGREEKIEGWRERERGGERGERGERGGGGERGERGREGRELLGRFEKEAEKMLKEASTLHGTHCSRNISRPI